MRNYKSGTITRVSINGNIPQDAKVSRLADLKHLFKNSSGTDLADDTLIYFVERVEAADDQTPEFSITTIMPGCVGDEYFFTRGHDHDPAKGETYFCISGQGGLVVEKDGEPEWLPMKPGDVIQLKSGWAHRTINTGTDPFVFAGQYIAPFDVDYAISERGFRIKVVNSTEGAKLFVDEEELSL
jgi:glucose-6-phosphate isomerase